MQADVFSVGVVAYILLAGDYPFGLGEVDAPPGEEFDAKYCDEYVRRKCGPLAFSSEAWRAVSPVTIDGIRNLLQARASSFAERTIMPHMGALRTCRACWAGRAARSRVHLLRTTAHLLAATPLGYASGATARRTTTALVRASASQPHTPPLLADFGLCSPTLRCDSVRTTRSIPPAVPMATRKTIDDDDGED